MELCPGADGSLCCSRGATGVLRTSNCINVYSLQLKGVCLLSYSIHYFIIYPLGQPPLWVDTIWHIVHSLSPQTESTDKVHNHPQNYLIHRDVSLTQMVPGNMGKTQSYIPLIPIQNRIQVCSIMFPMHSLSDCLSIINDLILVQH